MKWVIGLVGEKGSGKDTFANTVAEILPGRVSRVRSSDILSETLKIWNLPLSRHNLQNLAIVMDQGYGRGTLTKAVKKRIREQKEDIIIFDAVRWQTDAEMIRGFRNNLLVYITAPIKIRYKRTRDRKEKVGEEFATFERFVKEEQVKTELDIKRLGERADVKIENSSSLKNFQKGIQTFVEQKLK